MTTPRVTELPRRLEPISRDTFLGGCDADARPAVVMALRPRDAVGARRPSRARRGARPLRAVSELGLGDHVA